jgi:hypothetical protein
MFLILKAEFAFILAVLLKVVFSALYVELPKLVFLGVLLVQRVLLMLKSWTEIIHLLCG